MSTRWYMVGGGHAGNPVVYTEANTKAVRCGRPVVVIDPENREQVEQLQLAQWRAHGTESAMRDSLPRVADVLQAVLREYADPTPPKPDEPTGLGAVVVDGRDMRFVRCADGWLFAGGAFKPGEYRNPLQWHELSGVRVLSEGVAEA